MVFAAAIFVVLGALAFTLFIRGADLPEPEPVSPTAHLDDRKAQIYENLRDLQFEYRLGKLSDEDYGKTKQDLQRELARLLAEIDAASSAPKVVPPPAIVPNPKACPHCGATFDRALKFCGDCGKPMKKAGRA